MLKMFTHQWNNKNIAYLLFILFAAVYLVIVICNHYYFRTYSFDYAAYNYAFYDYAHLRISDNPVYHIPHMSFLQDHLSFTLMILSPLYWLFDWITGTYTLLFIQVLIELYGAWAVYKLIQYKTNSDLLSLFALLQYFFLIGRWTSFTSDCNLAIMASSMIPVFLYYFEIQKRLPALLVLIFILTSREDMALWTLFVGVFLFISHYHDDGKFRNASAIIVALSLVYFLLTFIVMIPAIETTYKKYTLFNYSALGNNPYEALKYIIRNPFRTLQLFIVNQSNNPVYDNIKTEFYVYYIAIGGFLLLFKPKYILLYIPILAKKMLNDDPIRWSVELYYSIEFVSILPITTFLIISELKSKKLKKTLIGVVCMTTLVLTIYGLNSHNRKLNWWGDRKYAFYKKTMYKADFDVKKVYHYLNQLPTDAKVSASGTIAPHLAFRQKIYYFPRVDDADYLIVFTKNDTYPLTQKQFDIEINKYRDHNEWDILVDDCPLLILKRKQPDLCFNRSSRGSEILPE